MKNLLLFVVFVVAAASVLLLVRFNKENNDVTRILEQERYSRMTAEEDLQKGEYRVKKLEADLQATQVRLSRNQEGYDKCKDEISSLKAEVDRAAQKGQSVEDGLRRDLDAMTKKKDGLEDKLSKAQEDLRVALNDLKQANARAQLAERKVEQQAAAAAAMAEAVSGKK